MRSVVRVNEGTDAELKALLSLIPRLPVAVIDAIVRLRRQRHYKTFSDLRDHVNAEAELVCHRLNQRWAEHLSVYTPAQRVRDGDYAAELLGLRLDVPWSIWDEHEAGDGHEPSILWSYDVAAQTFTVRFQSYVFCDDLEDVTWAEVLGEVPMAMSDGEAAVLHRLDELPLARSPRGAHTPTDGVWRMRGGVWINRHNTPLYEKAESEDTSSDRDESDDEDDGLLGSARRARNAYRPLRNQPFCVRRWRRRRPHRRRGRGVGRRGGRGRGGREGRGGGGRRVRRRPRRGGGERRRYETLGAASARRRQRDAVRACVCVRTGWCVCVKCVCVGRVCV